MLRALALALLFPLVVSAQTSARVEGARGPIYPEPALKLPLSYSGAPFDCLGAASCVYWNGSALVDVAGLVWTQNGTVPQVAANALPTTASTGAAGPFSDANYYAYPTASDPLDSTGDRWGCVGFVPSAIGALQRVLNNGTPGTAGYYAQVTASGLFSFVSSNPTAVSADTANVAVANGLNLGCWWRTGTSISAKLNLGTTATNAAAGAEVSGAAYSMKIGRAEANGSPFTGTILSVVQGLGACPTPPSPFAASCEGWATYQMKRQFGLLGTLGEEISITRATTATNEVNGLIWNVPAGVPRVTTNGLLVERASTNYVLQSSTSCVGNAVQTPWSISGTPTCTSDVATAPDGTTSMDEWASTNAGHFIQQVVTIPSSATYVGSVWVQKPVAGTASALVSATAATACACGTYDGSACTAQIYATNYCKAAWTAVGSTPTRAWVSATVPSATTSVTLILSPGNHAVSTGTSRFWGAQVETGTSATSYLPTTTLAATRNADVPTIAWPTMPDINKWCVKAVVTPYGGAAWNYTAGEVWSAGTASAANSARLIFTGGVLSFRVSDSTATFKIVTYTPTYAAGSTHMITACNANGALSIYSDGALVSGAASGAGAGTWTAAPATAGIGQMLSGANAAAGFSRNVTICKGGSAAQCR